ncbi:minor capsid protein [Enterococcus avium]|uniref:minor capsid protein n=1 Tax=Enterococcus avium TaxID=33945 RepID=UPI0032E41337
MLVIKINKFAFEKKMSVSNIKRGKFALANQAMADMNQYVPRKRGHLRMSGTSNGDRIAYRMPYAGPQFRGVSSKGNEFKNYTTPGTSRRWDLRAKANHLDDWRRAFIKGGNL